MEKICFFFFFSSRRRHTRFSRDWSSDVCSSDLRAGSRLLADVRIRRAVGWLRTAGSERSEPGRTDRDRDRGVDSVPPRLRFPRRQPPPQPPPAPGIAQPDPVQTVKERVAYSSPERSTLPSFDRAAVAVFDRSDVIRVVLDHGVQVVVRLPNGDAVEVCNGALDVTGQAHEIFERDDFVDRLQSLA